MVQIMKRKAECEEMLAVLFANYHELLARGVSAEKLQRTAGWLDALGWVIENGSAFVEAVGPRGIQQLRESLDEQLARARSSPAAQDGRRG